MVAYSAGAVTSLAWSPDGQYLAAASLDAPGFMVFDISLGTSTRLQAGVQGPPAALPVSCLKKVVCICSEACKLHAAEWHSI